MIKVDYYKTPQVIEVEATTKCALKCYSCPRTKYWHNRAWWHDGDISPKAIKEIVKLPSLKKIIFSGAYGDCIYHDKFHDLCKIIKDADHTIRIHIETNGFGRNEKWWYDLSNILRQEDDDYFVFSIDGLPHNYNTYRVNSKWDSIEKAIKVLQKSTIKYTWKWIVFKYNQDDLAEGYMLSKELGFKNITFVKSNRIEDENSFLEPTISVEEAIDKLKFKLNQDRLKNDLIK